MTYPPFLPINTGNAGVNPNHHYDVPFQFYDPTTMIVANAHQIISGALGGGGTYSGTATAIAAGTALDPGTVGGTAISSAFLHAGASITANALASGVALDAATLGGITLGNAVLTLANNPQTVTGNTAFTNGLTVSGGAGLVATSLTGSANSDFHIIGPTNYNLWLDSPGPSGSIYLTKNGNNVLGLGQYGGAANSVNYFYMQGAPLNDAVVLLALGETTGGMDVRSGNGPLYLNGFQPADVILGARAPLTNAVVGFPCIPLLTSNPIGTPSDASISVGWVAPLMAVSNTASGSYSLQTWMNGAWRPIPVGNSISSSALPATTGLYGGSGSQGQANAITVGTNLSLSGGTLSVPTTGTFSNYLPLSGGTLTNGLTINAAGLNITAGQLTLPAGGSTLTAGGGGGLYMDSTNTAFRLNNSNSSTMYWQTYGGSAPLMTMNANGFNFLVSGTFVSSLQASNATFSNAVTANTVIFATDQYHPGAGGTVTIAMGVAAALIYGTGTFSNLSIAIPVGPTVSTNQSQELSIYFANAVNSLNWIQSSTPVYGVALPTSAAQGTVVKMTYHQYTNAWMHYTII